jgi:phytoene/squalene synthetase
VTGFDQDLNACARLVERGDPARFRCVMAAPVAARRVLFPIYAFNVEVARAPWVTKEPMIARMRLQWWRDALEEIAEGGFVRRHEVVTPLAMAIGAPGALALMPLVEARDWDVDPAGFEDEDALWRYLEATSGRLMAVAACALTERGMVEGRGEDAEGRVLWDRAMVGGRALGLVNWLRAIPELEATGRRPLPNGRETAVAGLAARAAQDLVACRDGWRDVDRAARPAFYPLAGAAAVLRKVQARPGMVARGALVSEARLSLALMAATGRIF